MEVLSNLDKQHKLIEKKIKEMDEESAIVRALMSRLTFHALHMRTSLKKATTAQMFCKMFSKINDIISKYMITMTEISCKMERALCDGVHCWNDCYTSNSFIVKPLTSGICTTRDQNHTKKENKAEGLSTMKPLEFKPMNCMKKITDNTGNFLNHQIPLTNENLTNDKEPTLCNGSPSSSGAVIVKKEKWSIEEFNVAKLTERDYYGHIQHAVSPSELYVYFATEDIFLMEEFDKEISALSEDAEYKSSNCSYSKTEIQDPNERKAKAMDELGDYALCFFEVENLFHRAKIIDWNLSSSNDFIDVFFIDHGNKMRVSIDDVYPVPENLRKYPAFAVRCHLYDAVPRKGDIEWTPAEIEALKKWIEENEEVSIIVDEHRSDTSHSLPIHVCDMKKTKNLNGLIRESRSSGKGVERSENGDESPERVLDEWDPMREAYDSHLNSYEINIDHPAIPVYGHIPKDDRRLCKIFRETGRCYKGEGCRKEHAMLDEKGYTTDREEVFANSFASLHRPKVGDVLNVRITFIPNGCEFFCVQERPETDGTEETLDSLASYMNAAENVRKMKKLKIPPSVGEIVVSKFPGDENWYRAKVLEVSPENDEYLVLFVDYGNTETVGFSCLRAIQPRYLHLPFQAMLCEIEGIRIRPGAEKEAVEFLDENLPASVAIKVTGTFPGERPHLMVKLSSVNHPDVGRLLLKKKYAEPKENFILNESQSLLPG